MESPLFRVPETAKYARISEDYVRRKLKYEVPHVQH
jgi:hypothetical protein